MPITDKNRKILWAKSGNRCAICRKPLVVEPSDLDPESVIGEAKMWSDPNYTSKNGVGPQLHKSYLKNCRACSIQSECMKKPLKEHGRQVSFRVDGEDNHNYLDLMKQKIDSEQGRNDYARRMNKLTLRGKAKVTCQWMICCIMHNIEKLWRYGDISIVGA